MFDVFGVSYILLWIIVAGTLMVIVSALKHVAVRLEQLSLMVHSTRPRESPAGPKEGDYLWDAPVETQGERTLVLFLSTQCSHCRQLVSQLGQIPDLAAMNVRAYFKDEVTPASEVVEPLDKLGLKYEVAPRVFERWDMTAVPQVVLVDRAGMVLAHGIGGGIETVKRVLNSPGKNEVA